MRNIVYIIARMNEADLFTILADDTRRRLLALLGAEGELCVCELFHALKLPQPKVSRHLALMRESGVLAARRDATWIYYRIEPRLPAWAARILEALPKAGNLPSQLKQDRARLDVMPNRPMRCCA